MHLRTLIAEARGDADAECLAHNLLAAVSATLFVHQRHELGMSLDRIKAGLDDALAGIT